MYLLRILDMTKYPQKKNANQRDSVTETFLWKRHLSTTDEIKPNKILTPNILGTIERAIRTPSESKSNSNGNKKNIFNNSDNEICNICNTLHSS